ncbi:hypothetical protein H1R20_g13594, partial [Candolleomyces eurysporus]
MCDNAGANDTMIDKVGKLIFSYPGAANQVRCLAHVVNLVVKIILWQFNSRRKTKTSEEASKGVKKSKTSDGDKTEVGGDKESVASSQSEPDSLDLGGIADVIEQEEKEMNDGYGDDKSEGEEIGKDEVEWFEVALGGKAAEVAASSRPMRLVLTKL